MVMVSRFVNAIRMDNVLGVLSCCDPNQSKIIFIRVSLKTRVSYERKK